MNRLSRRWFLLLALATLVSLALLACGESGVTIGVVSLVDSAGTDVEVGKTVGIDVKVNNPSGTQVTFRWEPADQVKTTTPTSPAAIYQAPKTPGDYMVTVYAIVNGKEKDHKSIKVTVVSSSSTVTLALTNTPTQPSPTRTVAPPTPTETRAPVPPIGTPVSASSPRQPIQGVQLAGTVQIVKPASGARLSGMEQTTSGTYGGVADNIDIWILVYPHGAMQYWPQPRVGYINGPAVKKDGRWEALALLGDPPGDSYDIVAVLADKDASKFFIEWLKAGPSKTPPHPGMEPSVLPKGIQEAASVTVYRER